MTRQEAVFPNPVSGTRSHSLVAVLRDAVGGIGAAWRRQLAIEHLEGLNSAQLNDLGLNPWNLKGAVLQGRPARR